MQPNFVYQKHFYPSKTTKAFQPIFFHDLFYELIVIEIKRVENKSKKGEIRNFEGKSH